MKTKFLFFLLILFGMGGSSFAKEHDFTLYPPRIPEPRSEEAEPINLVPPIFAQTNTFCAANLACTITGLWSFNSLTVSGTTTLATESVQSANGVQKCERFGTPGVTSFNTLMAACLAALPATGTGIADASNVTDATNLTMTGNFVINRNNTKFIHGNYTVLMGTNQITCPSPCINVGVEGIAPIGSDPSGTVTGAVFRYTGAGGAFLMGDTLGTSYNHRVKDISVFINTANTGTAECFVSTRVYHSVYDSVRCIGFAGANTQIGIDNNGTTTAPGSQNMLIINPYISNVGIGIRCIGGNSPPSCNMNQIIGGEYTGPGSGIAGSIGLDIENGNNNWLFGLTISNVDTAVKVAATSFNAVMGYYHAESCGATQGVLFSTGSKNNVLQTDAAGACAVVNDVDGAAVSQNIVRDPSITTGLDWVYGSINTIGTTFLNQFNNGLRVGPSSGTGCPGLPSTTATFGYICGNLGAPNSLDVYTANSWEVDIASKDSGIISRLYRFNGGATGSALFSNSLALGGLSAPAATGLATPKIYAAQLVGSNSNPSIAAGGCGGAAASLTNANGTFAFSINVGTTPGTTCTITMPSGFTTGFACSAWDKTNPTTAGGYYIKVTSDSSSQIVLTFFNNAGAATAPTASDVIRIGCTGD